jgi:hypothetical protein
MGGGLGTGTNGRMKRRGVVKVVGRALIRSHLSIQGVTAYHPHRQAASAAITRDTNEVPTTYRRLRYVLTRLQITVQCLGV